MENFRLDPRTKLIIFFIMGAAIFSYMPTFIVGIYGFLAFLLLLLSRKYKDVAVYIILYFIIRVIIYLAYNYDFLFLNSFKGLVSIFSMYFLFLVYGRYFILTTSISEFSLALEKIRIPLGIQIILLVMIRYFPTIRVEFKSIFNAMRLRGVSFNPLGFIKHPVKTIEYLYVPLVYSLIKIGDELTIAALTKGLGLYSSRTYLTEIGFTFRDLIFLFISFGLILIGILIKGEVI